MTLVSLSDVAVHFGGVPLFEHVSFTVQPGERWGVVGRNGSGKTTLMDLVRGVRRPDVGAVSRAGSMRIAVMTQDRDFDGVDTVWAAAARGFGELFALEASLEQQMAEMGVAGDAVSPAMLDRYAHDQERFEREGGYAAHARVDAVLSGLGFDPTAAHDQRIATLSGGERGRLALAEQLAAPADLLILDEPTNHLDLATASWLEGYLRDLNEAVLLISHDRAFLAAVADHMLHVEGGTAVPYTGGWAEFVHQRTERRMAQERAVRKQATKLAAEEDYIRRNKAGQNANQARGRSRRLARVERLSPPPGAEGVMAVVFEPSSRGGDQVLVTDRLTVAMEGRQLIAPWSGLLRRGEIVGLIGANGAGKTTFLKTVLGERPPSGGEVRLMPAVEVAHYRQDLGDVDPAATLYGLIADRRPMWTRGQVQGHLGRFGFSGDEVLRRAGTLSGGERARVALALMMLARANLLVFDEPTNHLDVESIEALEDALEAFDGTVLLVSHDRALLTALTTRIWALEDGRLVDFPGNYLEYAADKVDREGRRDALAREAMTPTGDPRTATKAAAAARRRLERSIGGLERRVTELEAVLAKSEARLADPALYAESDGAADAARLVADRDQTRAALQEAMAEWTAAASALESRL